MAPPIRDIDSRREQEYRPHQPLGWGPAVWREMIAEQRNAGEIVWRLFLRDFKSRYQQSLLGILWALITPGVLLFAFVVLHRVGVLNIGETDVPYPVFALLGLTFWQLFADGLNACSQAIVSGGSMVAKVRFPREALVVSALGRALFETLLRFTMLVPVFLIYGIAPKWTVVALPLVLLPLVALTLGIGFVFALVHCVARDVGHLVPLALTALMLLTPVMYPAMPGTGLAAISALNPLAAFVTAGRDLVLDGTLSHAHHFAWSSVLAFAVALVGWRVFHLAESKLAEVV